jgi:hypothetical protein
MDYAIATIGSIKGDRIVMKILGGFFYETCYMGNDRVWLVLGNNRKLFRRR